MAQDEDDLRIDGEIINGTFATCAAKVPLQFVRYCRYSWAAGLLAKVFLFFLATVVVLVAMRFYGAALLAALPAILVFSLLMWVRRKIAVIFQNALLTPGIVISAKPLEFVAMANMDTGFGKPSCAVKRLAIDALPGYEPTPGTRFPCVSHFREGPQMERWENFFPEPLSFGTGDKELLQARMDKLGNEDFEELEEAIRKGRIPKQAEEILFLDEPPKMPPPLPPTVPPPLPSMPPRLPGR